MAEVGRRGATSLMYEIVISLVLLGLFAATAYLYVSANATGEQYYSQFYAEDLATSADLVTAGNGDVVLRYDNLKPELDLTFWLTNGKVAVAKSPVPSSGAGFSPAGSQARTNLSYVEPPTAVKRYYGKAQDYPKPGFFVNPTYLALRKVGESVAITEAEVLLDECPADAPNVKLADALVWFSVEGLTSEETERAERAFEETLPKSVARATEESKATVRIQVKRATGDALLAIDPTGEDGAQFACLFWRHLTILSLHEWEKPAVQPSGSGFSATATVTTSPDVLLRPEQVGQAAALAVSRMYGKGAGSDDGGAP